MKKRIAIIDGIRTPFCRMGSALAGWNADDLGAIAVKELVARTAFEAVDEVIVGNGVQPAEAANIARIIALKAGLDQKIPAYTVQRNCASGMEAVTTAANKIAAGEIDTAMVAATESMSHIPMLFSREMTQFFMRLSRAKTLFQKVRALASFRPSFLKPVVGLQVGLTDPICGLNMGITAENIAREFYVTRDEQDAFALQSHKRATEAITKGRLADEIIPTPVAPKMAQMQMEDDGVRKNQTAEALGKLRPYFDKLTGTVTAGNSSQITDGACALLLMNEETAKERQLPILGYLRSYAYAGLDGARMGLGPVYATARLIDKQQYSMNDFSLIELNEAFAAQVLACVRAYESQTFAQEHLGRSAALGAVDPEILNVNGGAIALGHPIGATGARLILTLLRELKRRQQSLGLATLCIGGGQGAAMALEVE